MGGSPWNGLPAACHSCEQLHELGAERVAAEQRHGGAPHGEVHRRELAGALEVAAGDGVVAAPAGLDAHAEVQARQHLVVGEVGDRGAGFVLAHGAWCRRAPTRAPRRGAGPTPRR